MSKTARPKKWHSLIQQANTALLDRLHQHSTTQQYVEPPPIFPKTKESLLALQQKVATLANADKDLSESTQQIEASEDMTLLDPDTFEQNAVIIIKGYTKLLPSIVLRDFPCKKSLSKAFVVNLL